MRLSANAHPTITLIYVKSCCSNFFYRTVKACFVSLLRRSEVFLAVGIKIVGRSKAEYNKF